jgi:steroid 5-alpha reductase family enzyme
MIVMALAALGAALLMTLAWEVVRRTGSGGWTDVVWTFAVGLVGAGVALAPAPGADPLRQGLAATLIGLWALRLGLYLWARTWKAEEVDPRYVMLTRRWGGWGFQAWLFLMIQAAVVWLLALSIRAGAIRPEADIGWREGVAVALLVAAIVGEGVADAQMAAFRKGGAGRGKVMDRGLWAWSRHPNYFFQWLGWLAWPVMALDPAYAFGWAALVAPVFMWWLLNHVSGVPMLEAQMLKTRPEAYRAYQARVSRFLPLPPRRG